MLGTDADGVRLVRSSFRPLQQVHLRRADEASNKEVPRIAVEFQRAANLFNDAVLQHDNLVGHGHRLDLVMCDIDHCCRKTLVEFADFQPHADTQRGVKIGQGLVKQEGSGFPHNGPADGNALALAARQLTGAPVKIFCQVQNPGRVLDPPRLFRLVKAGHAEREGDVLANRHMRVERIGLEHHGKAAPRRRNGCGILAIDDNLSRGHILKAGNQA